MGRDVGRRPKSIPGPGYLCKLCRQPGHWMTDCPKYVPKYVLLCCCDYHDYFFFFNAAVVVAIRLTVHFLCVCIFVFLSFLFFTPGTGGTALWAVVVVLRWVVQWISKPSNKEMPLEAFVLVRPVLCHSIFCSEPCFSTVLFLFLSANFFLILLSSPPQAPTITPATNATLKAIG